MLESGLIVSSFRATMGPQIRGQPVLLTVDSVGYLVPNHDFDGTVHSVFARACNIACEGILLTLAVPGLADGPAALVLARATQPDLRTLFRAGERICRRDGVVRSPRVTIDVGAATVACPARLIGLGEGLTPAGDDFLVGLCAGLATCAGLHSGLSAWLDGDRPSRGVRRR